LDLGDDRFRIEKVIGEGGTARVFRAVDVRDGSRVAVKVLRDFLLASEESVARFQLEADLLGRFDHPNILPLLGRGTVVGSGEPWFACTYAAHGSLADRMLRDGSLGPHELVGHIAEILDALHYLHGQQFVHRDVKPENILIDEQNIAMLCDFGIALSPFRRSTLVGDRMGTPSFMPPEQYLNPEQVTAHADLFGAGVTLFVGLTGQTGMVLLVEHLRAEALSLLPDFVRPVVDRATSLRAEDRYPSAWAMSLDLADVLDRTM
jgi:serine/threonine protein kinase